MAEVGARRLEQRHQIGKLTEAIVEVGHAAIVKPRLGTMPR